MANIVLNGLIGYWHYKEGIEGNAWKNIAPSTKGQYDGTIVGTTMTDDGLYFDRVDDKVSIGNYSGGETTFTIEYLVKPNTTTTYNQPVFGIGSGYAGFSWTGDMRYAFSSRTSVVSIQTGNDVFNGFHHYAMKVSTSPRRVDFYIDGSFIGSQSPTSNMQSLSGALNIGGTADPRDMFGGSIVFVRLYNKHLTDQEIEHNSTFGNEVGMPTTIIEDGLLGYWHYAEGLEGTTWRNIAPATKGVNDGVIYGATVDTEGLQFNGTSDHVLFPNFNMPYTSSNITIEIGLRWEGHSQGTLSTLLGVDVNRQLFITNNNLSVASSSKGSSNLPTTLSQNNSSIIQLYTENGLTYDYNNTSSNSTSDLSDLLGGKVSFTIGRSSNSSFKNYKGRIMFVRIYERKLSSEEALSNYSLGVDTVGLPPPTTMKKYLLFDGVDDRLDTPMMSFNRVTMSLSIDKRNLTTYIISKGIPMVIGSTGSIYVDSGITAKIYGDVITNWNIPLGERVELELSSQSLISSSIVFFNDMVNFTSGRIWDIKVYNGQTLVAHYDIASGTLHDKSGNANYALLTGGTWVEYDEALEPPKSVKNASWSINSSKHVILYWDNPNDYLFSMVNIYKDGVKIEETTEESYIDTDVVAGNTYLYEIASVGSNGVEGEKIPLSITINESAGSIVKDGLVSYWHHEEGFLGNVWKNISPNTEDNASYDLNVVGAIKKNGGIYFDGIDDRAYSKNSFPVLNETTLEMVVTVNSLSTNSQIMGLMNVGNLPLTYYNYEGLVVGFIYGINEQTGMPVTYGTLRISEKFHIALSVSSLGNTKLYLNGNLVANGIMGNEGIGTFIELFSIQNFYFTNATMVAGRVYNRVLTDEEINSNYFVGDDIGLEEPSPPKIATEGLVGYWNYNYGFNGSAWENISPNTRGNYDAQVEGASLLEDGVYIDGIDDKVIFGINKTNPSDYAIEVGFTIDNINTGNTIIGIKDEYIRLDVDYGEVLTTNTYLVPTDTVEPNKLIHVALQYSLSDGTEAITVNNTDYDINPHDLSGIFNQIETIRPYKGKIAYLRLYDRLLSEDELTQNYMVGTSLGIEEPTEEPTPTEPPSVTIINVTKNKISDEPNMDRSIIKFKFDQDVVEWTVRVLGVSPDTGTVADGGANVSANTEITAEVDWTELYQEGENRVNIYGKNASGQWTPYVSG